MHTTIRSLLAAILTQLHRYEWLGPAVLRLGFGYFWLETGWAKLQHLDGFTQRFEAWGIPFPAFSAALSATTDLVGGALLMLGLLTRLVCVPMIVNMVVAIVLVVSRDLTGLDEYVESSEVTYILILFWLLMAGPGKASVDAWLVRQCALRPSR